MSRKIILPGLALAAYACVAPFAGATEALPKDICSYAVDVGNVDKGVCENPGRLRDSRILEEASRNASRRKRDVLELVQKLRGVDKLRDFIKLDPPMNERTLRAWLSEREAGEVQGKLVRYVQEAYKQWRQASRTEAPGDAGPLEKRLAFLKGQLTSLGVDLADPKKAAAFMEGSHVRENRDLGQSGFAAAAASGKPALSRKALSGGRSMGGLDLTQGPPTPSGGKGKNVPRSGWDDLIDRKADPCSDFYQYACGTWVRNHPLNGKSSFDRFDELHDRNAARLRVLLQEAAAKLHDDGAGENEKKVGAFFGACMDQKTIESKGAEPLKPEFDRIETMADKTALAGEIARLHAAGIPVLLNFGSEPDPKNASRMIASLSQGGLSLPDRDYYLKDQFAGERKAYAKHVQRMFELLGDGKARSAAETAAVLSIETALAGASMPREEMRDPANIFHRMDFADLGKLAPSLDWKRYLAGVGVESLKSLDVSTPGFFKGLEDSINTVSLEDWKTYLRWRVVHHWAKFLPSAFVKEDFNFYAKELSGQKKMDPRWKQCVEKSDEFLGDALGRIYVERHFKDKEKALALEMVESLEKAMGGNIREVPWMSDATKKQASNKLEGIANKMGYPDSWQDYGKLTIVGGDALGNAQRAAALKFRKTIDKIGRKADKKEWDMTPPTVNAYYNPQDNTINFPSGILQPPFFDKKADPARNFGAIGVVIGHEITHGFDDEGRKFDAEGNLRDWWTPQDNKAFEERAQCFEEEYSKFTAVKDANNPAKDVKVNGKVTLGENIADNGGMRIAYQAMQASLSGKERLMEGFTPQQRFFLGFASVWCGNSTDQDAKLRASSDVHSPPIARVNGTVSNMPEFQRAFNCRAGAPMVREAPCRAW